MSDDVRVEPALTADEWAGGWLKRSAAEYEWNGPDGFAIVGPDGVVQIEQADDAHALMALANYLLPDDDHRKFMRDMVTRLRNIALYLRGEAEAAGADGVTRVVARSHAAELDEYAAKLAALLPPEAA